MILSALTQVITTSLLISSTLRLRGKVAFLLALYLLSIANIILAGYILGLGAIRQLNNQALFLGFHGFLLLIAFFFWRRSKSPSLWGPFNGTYSLPSWQALKTAIAQNPDLTLFALGMFIFYVFSFVLGVTVPPNNYDSLSTHLSRVGYWLQFGSYIPWPTPNLNQVIYPLNAQLPILWSILFTGGDQLVAVWQLLAVLVCGLSALGITRLLGYSLRSSIFVALIVLGFPLLILQSSTPQTDMATTGLYAMTVYLFLLGIRNQNLPSLALMALSIGLGIGTKKSFLLLMPGLGILILMVGWQYGRNFLKRIWRWGILALVIVAALGSSYIFINMRTFGQPFGPADYMSILFGKTDVGSLTGRTLLNTPRLIYQSLDPSGLPRPFGGYAHKIKARVGHFLSDITGFEIEGTAFTAPGHTFDMDKETVNEESNAWFGPLSALLLFPAIIYELARGLRQRHIIKLGLIFTFIIFWPLDALIRPGWDPYQGRYFAPLFVTAAPLMAIWFEKKQFNFISGSTTVLALIVAGYTLFYNPAKPTLGKWADDIGVWQKDRIFLMTAQHQVDRNMHYMIDHNVPQNATIGFANYYVFTDYPLFGEHFTRRVIPVFPAENLSNKEWLRQQNIEYLLITDGMPFAPPPTFDLIAQVDRWKLYQFTKP